MSLLPCSTRAAEGPHRRGSFVVPLVLLVALLASGCNGVFWGNLGVLSVTVAIFLGTVFLSRSTTNRGANRSSASTSHHS
jgi:uncharacterized membrane protein